VLQKLPSPHHDGDENDPLPINARSDALWGLSCTMKTVSPMTAAVSTPNA
jgi:hypothetical protein